VAVLLSGNPRLSTLIRSLPLTDRLPRRLDHLPGGCQERRVLLFTFLVLFLGEREALCLFAASRPFLKVISAFAVSHKNFSFPRFLLPDF